MSLNLPTFDRLAYVDRLKSGGVEEKQARAHAEALDAALRDTVATRSDVSELRTELRSEMSELRTELRSEMSELRTGLRTEMSELRNELRSEMGELRNELEAVRSELGAVRKEILIESETIRRDVSHDMDKLRVELRSEIATSAANLKVDILRWLIVTQVALGGILLAALKFAK